MAEKFYRILHCFNIVKDYLSVRDGLSMIKALRLRLCSSTTKSSLLELQSLIISRPSWTALGVDAGLDGHDSDLMTVFWLICADLAEFWYLVSGTGTNNGMGTGSGMKNGSGNNSVGGGNMNC